MIGGQVAAGAGLSFERRLRSIFITLCVISPGLFILLESQWTQRAEFRERLSKSKVDYLSRLLAGVVGRLSLAG